MNAIKALVLTSNSFRHRYLCNIINDSLNLVGIISEDKGAYYNKQMKMSKVIEKHFQDNLLMEEKVFGNFDLPTVPNLSIKKNEINDLRVLCWAKEKKPDIVILFGTGILDDTWLDSFSDKVINVHLGYSPYYRGSATLFWPFYNNDLEHLGVTIHLAARQVDSGKIIEIIKNNSNPEQSYYHITNNLIKRAIDKVPDIVNKYFKGDLELITQDLSLGKVYKKNDFSELTLLKALAVLREKNEIN